VDSDANSESITTLHMGTFFSCGPTYCTLLFHIVFKCDVGCGCVLSAFLSYSNFYC